MKKIFAVLATVLLLFAAGWAQSGRRIQPMPTPVPKTEENPTDYSESTPQKRRISISPTFRNIPGGSKTDAGTQAANIPNDTSSADGEDVVKVETNLITIPVSVFDRNGLYIPNLRRENFKIFEDGREQEIAYFATADKPFTVILLLDTSPSTEYKIDEIQRAATAFVDQLQPHDSVMVIEFAWNVHILTEPTRDRQQIYKAIKRADFGDGTSLYDAVDFSLRKRLNKIEGRKAIVLFTDGVDTTSGKANYDSTLNEAEESDVLIFPIYYNTFFDNRRSVSTSLPDIFGRVRSPRGTSASDYALGRQYLDELAGITGGRVFRPEATPGGLTAAFEGIAEELRRQYNIGYIPQDEGKPGQRKQIKVRVNRPNLMVRNRDSYIVGTAAKSSSPNTSTEKPK